MNLNLFIAKKIGGSGTIACVSVAISMLVMFVAISISDGFRKEIGEKAVGFSGEIIFTVPGQEPTTDKYPLTVNMSYLPDVEKLPDVNHVAWTAYKAGMAKTDENVHGILLKGVDSLYPLEFFSKNLVEGELPSFSGKSISNDILISKRLADILGYKTGDKMTAYFIDDNVRVRRFTISGLYNIRLDDIDERMVIADIRHVQRLNGWENDQVSSLELYLDGAEDAMNSGRREKVAGEIDRIILDAPDNVENPDSPVVVKMVDDVYWHLFDWLELLDLNVVVVLALMMVVAGFNMISGLLILLFEKISMIGLLKALGMKTRQICYVFLYKSAGIVLKGMLIGDSVALVLTLVQKYTRLIPLDPSNYFVDHIPVSIDPVKMILLNVIAFVVMMLIMVIPSFFISKVSPARTVKMA